MTVERTRPAFYALPGGGWRDYVTLLHPPYTLWHLSYVAIGAGLAPTLHGDRLLAALAAFALALGVGAHALDELHGRPLGTAIGTRTLAVLGAGSIAVGVAIGVGAALAWTPWLLVLVAAGGFVVVAYNLELARGRFHGDRWFAASWGALPVLSAYLVQTGTLRAEAVAGAAFAFALSLAQRRLSTEVRELRRRTAAVEGRVVAHDGRERSLDVDSLLRAPESALRALVVATVTLAAALLLLHAR